MTDDSFVVICREDRTGRRKGPYALATRQVFATADEARIYAGTVHVSREPLVVAGRWHQLRPPTTVPREKYDEAVRIAETRARWVEDREATIEALRGEIADLRGSRV